MPELGLFVFYEFAQCHHSERRLRLRVARIRKPARDARVMRAGANILSGDIAAAPVPFVGWAHFLTGRFTAVNEAVEQAAFCDG